jgi:hypothetical protein
MAHTWPMRAPSHRTLARMTDLTTFGSYYAYLFAMFVIGAGVGGLLGWLLSGDPAIGLGSGGFAGMLTWIVLVVWATRVLQRYEGRRRAEL